MTNTPVHVVIPIFNNYPMLHELLWKLQRIEGKNISSITLVDDCSPDPEVAGGMKWWASEYGSKFPIHILRNSDNLGFLLTSNGGLQYVCNKNNDADIVILLNTDVKINYPFIQQIKDIIEVNPKSLIGGILYTQSTGWNVFNDKIYPYIEGWLMATTVSGWKELDYLDERYTPCDFEDVHLSTKALSLGYELAPLNNPGIFHVGGASIGYTDKRLEQTKINQKKFEEAWTNS